MNKEDQLTLHILYKYALDTKKITQSTYYSNVCNLKTAKIPIGLSGVAFDLVKLFENGINSKNHHELFTTIAKIKEIRDNFVAD